MFFIAGFLAVLTVFVCHLLGFRSKFPRQESLVQALDVKSEKIYYHYITLFHIVSGAVLFLTCFDVIAKTHLYGLLSFIALNYFLFFVWRAYSIFVSGYKSTVFGKIELLGLLLAGVFCLSSLYM
ncbi:hypothetical protein D5R81_00420 [Parashewanella spongiae]|uniref:Uncharacterized protein n=1 Tax=Parashewanella spongiae TaxID=342950 RepID=A0A3A6TY62_9GAMM|nr:hypothetical protein [Parashewanella spongiae]MCL1080171.1 hypothetical protein [Parashewanella spongiae]RJY19449.1 hypothetical protein D5R81_00420 [Parashewanella spongiae]